MNENEINSNLKRKAAGTVVKILEGIIAKNEGILRRIVEYNATMNAKLRADLDKSVEAKTQNVIVYKSN